MRLIDADKLKKDILLQNILGEPIQKIIDRYIHIVDNQPTAFDVDKVVEQIEHRRANFDCKLCKYNDDEKTICSEDCSDALIDDLIKIVKEGGLNERNSF